MKTNYGPQTIDECKDDILFYLRRIEKWELRENKDRASRAQEHLDAARETLSLLQRGATWNIEEQRFILDSSAKAAEAAKAEDAEDAEDANEIDQPENDMNLRSHTKEDLQLALDLNIKVWSLDTNTYGEDDVLTGEYEEVLTDICHHFAFDSIPEDWTLTRISELP